MILLRDELMIFGFLGEDDLKSLGMPGLLESMGTPLG